MNGTVLCKRVYEWLVARDELQTTDEDHLYDRIISSWRPLADTFVQTLNRKL